MPATLPERVHEVDRVHAFGQALDHPLTGLLAEEVRGADLLQRPVGHVADQGLIEEARAALAYVDGAPLTGPLVHVLEQVTVDRTPVLGIERTRHQLRVRGQLVGATTGQHPLRDVQLLAVGDVEPIPQRPEVQRVVGVRRVEVVVPGVPARRWCGHVQKYVVARGRSDAEGAAVVLETHPAGAHLGGHSQLGRRASHALHRPRRRVRTELRGLLRR